MSKMRRSQKFTIGLIVLSVGVILLGADRLLVSASDATSYGQSMTYLTIIALLFLLVGTIWLFRVTLE